MPTKLFSPKYKQFYALFDEISEAIYILSGSFAKLVSAQNLQDASSHNQEIKKKSASITDLCNTTLRELQENFITPFDREDIVDLVASLKGINGHMNTTARRMMMYSMFPSEPFNLQFSEIVSKGCEDVNKGVHLLREGKLKNEMKEIINRLYTYEDEADDLYNKGIQKVLEDDNDFKTFFKEKDLYQKMELITDELEAIANVLESIMIKYA